MIEFFFESASEQVISTKIWKPALEKLLVRVGLKGKSVSISFVSADTMARLNLEHRRKSGPTDVLSYELGSEGKGPFGEVILCPEVVKQNASEDRIPFSIAILEVIVHGLLHLKGLDHKDSSQKTAMFALQEALVNEFRFEIFDPKLIVGLGNPGGQYVDTRHNVGFMLVDHLCGVLKCGEPISRCGASIANSSGKAPKLLAKPSGGMNRVGAPVACLSKELDIDPREILLVVHDDLDLRLGEYKYSYGKSGRLHNGICDVEKSLKTKKFWRLRIGVDNRSATGSKRTPGAEYVLEKFSSAECQKVQKVIKKAIAELHC